LVERELVVGGLGVGVCVPWKRPPKEKKRVAIFVVGIG